MIDQIRRNAIYYTLTAVFVLSGLVILGLLNLGDEVLYFGHDRSDEWNTFFKITTQFGEEITYVVLLVILLYVRFSYALFLPFLGLLVTLVSFALKFVFKHPRPGLYFRGSDKIANIDYIDGVHLLTGLNSFPSGHTLSAFCLFGFFAYTMHRFRYGALIQICCFVLAFLVGLSRIYLFQHFLKDVVFGAFLGTLLAFLCIALIEIPNPTSNKWFNKSFNLTQSSPKV